MYYRCFITQPPVDCRTHYPLGATTAQCLLFRTTRSTPLPIALRFRTIEELILHVLLRQTLRAYTAETTNCASFECPYGYALVDDADDEVCKYGKCDKSKCCDKVCSSYDCPKYYELVDDSDTTVCKDYKCTKDQCCVPRESAVFKIDLPPGVTFSVCIIVVSPFSYRHRLIVILITLSGQRPAIVSG